ncbi:MAG TPA: hypothetical protein DCY27_07405 [Desulfobacterales bacterium]|nr:hypothetical protein [Desulfobacterales bacterium]
MHVEFLLEEESAEVALNNLLPKILPQQITYTFHVFQGKQNLLKKLPERFRGYRRWLPPDWIIVVLLDFDQGDCQELKGRLERIAEREGFTTLSKVGCHGRFQVINRLAVKELEAWFFGDFPAIRQAYPRFPIRLEKKKNYRNPDAIDNPWETLEKIFKGAGYYPGGLPKKEVAGRISENMNPWDNQSKSFQVFRDTLRKICPQSVTEGV